MSVAGHPTTRERSPRPGSGPSGVGVVGWLAFALFVVYGSLVPLDYRPLPPGEAWVRFQHIPFLQLGVGSRADWIANGVLYAPLGFLGTLALLRRGWWSPLAVLLSVATAWTLALAVEYAQLFFPPRTVSLNDLLAESIGSVLGALAAAAVARHRAGFQRLQRSGRGWVEAHALGLFLFAYVAYSLFPYDLLLSWPELQDKLASDRWGWWLAGDGGRPLIALLRLAVEVPLAAPIGWLWARAAPVGPAPSSARAAAVGLGLGLALEAAQLLIETGTSQGASVLARGAGVVLGVALWRARARWHPEAVRAATARAAPWLLPPYLLLLLAVNGWFAGDWQGVDAAAAKAAQLRFLPFYYHYYTTEAAALVSLASVALMYLPVGVLVWARRAPAVWGVVGAALLCSGVEFGKLWLAGLRPDPTNPWIAAFAAWSWPAAIDWLSRQQRAGPTATGAERRRAGRGGNVLWLVAAGLLLALHAWGSPAFALASTCLLLLCAAAVWHRPLAAVLIVPALLPALDLAPWTGRLLWDEFDVLLALVLAVGYWRVPPDSDRRAAVHPWWLAFGLLALSYAVSAGIGSLPPSWPDANTLSSYDSPFSALRIAKGLVWAGLFVGLSTRLSRRGRAVAPPLAWGMTLGLAYVVVFVLWERLNFVALLDFASDYRVTGPFSAMHRGGAFIECYVALAIPFVVDRIVAARRWAARLAGLSLLAAAGYVMAVTFSRNGYVALAVALAAWMAVSLRRGGRSGRETWIGLAAALATLALALPVLRGEFAQERLSRWTQDLGVRQAHWADALAIRDDGVATELFGMGLGRFPTTHYWRSREAAHAATFRVESEQGRRFLRLGGGAPTYLDQIVSPAGGDPHTLTLRLRSNQPAVPFKVSVCRKWMLTSADCQAVEVLTADQPGTWTTVSRPMDLSAVFDPGSLWPQPVKLALHSPAPGQVVDLAQVALQGADGRMRVHNGDFAHGLDRWWFTTDVDPPWKIHSLPVAVLFDQGALGVLAWAVLLATALYSGARHGWAGDAAARAGWTALLAFCVSGTVNTLIDEPRFLFLLLVLTWLCTGSASPLPRRHPGKPGGLAPA